MKNSQKKNRLKLNIILNIFVRSAYSTRRPAASKAASEATSKAASERRAVKEDELPAELEQQGQRDEARRRLSHLQQVTDQRRAELQQRFADQAVHLAQRQLKNLR